jgi:hypothetical protein
MFHQREGAAVLAHVAEKWIRVFPKRLALAAPRMGADTMLGADKRDRGR